MSAANKPRGESNRLAESLSELLILPDGRILVHNLTRTMAIVLQELNPNEDVIRPRAQATRDFRTSAQLLHELPD